MISERALNRATLARQLLLQRNKISPVAAVERLAGMQAQLARPPYVGLWSRLEKFSRAQLTRAALDRQLVRATLMRATLHLVSARDYRLMRPAIQPALDKAMRSVLRERADAIDLPKTLSHARTFFGKQARTFDELRAHLGGDTRAMGYVVRCTLPLVQVPVEGSDWGWPGVADFALAESWLGAPIDGEPAANQLVLRYLAAFGPATPADAQTWSGLQGLQATFEALKPKLKIFADARGRDLYDLPKAPRPDEDCDAPARFLPEYDNLMMAHADRSRLVDEAHRPKLFRPNLVVPATFLLDGRIAGTWKIARKKKSATLELAPFAALQKKSRAALEEEGNALLQFVEPDAGERVVKFS